jgi:hypothetical protein
MPARRGTKLVQNAPLLGPSGQPVRSTTTANTSRRAPMLIRPAIGDTDPFGDDAPVIVFRRAGELASGSGVMVLRAV